MLISHSHRLVCFSNPKTGSESLRQYLAPLSEQEIFPFRQRKRSRGFYPHVAPFEAATLFDAEGWDFSRYRKVSFIRNPFSRLVSLYEMIARADRLEAGRVRWRLKRRSFADWVKGIRTSGQGGGGWQHQRWRRFGTYEFQHWAPMINGRPSVDHVIRLEDVGIAVPELIAKLDLPDLGQFPRVNIGKTQCLDRYYTPELIAYVERLYKTDIAKFNYSFP